MSDTNTALIAAGVLLCLSWVATVWVTLRIDAAREDDT